MSSELLSLVLNFILGTGLLGTLLFYGARRRKEQAEASGVELENQEQDFEIHRRSVEFLSAQLSQAYTEIDKMQSIINLKREEIVELMRMCKELEVDLIEHEAQMRIARMNICLTQSCSNREREVVR